MSSAAGSRHAAVRRVIVMGEGPEMVEPTVGRLAVLKIVAPTVGRLTRLES
jgi:hypothetical protein